MIKILDRQKLLTLQPVNMVESESKDALGSLGTWKFDQEAIRKSLAHMIIVDELPFKSLQREGFKKFLCVAYPRFKLPSRTTLTRDCFELYMKEKQSLTLFFRNHCQRVSITTDAWTSIQQINYMCITAHFIDDQWKLHKKIISFVPITSHKVEYIAQALDNYLLEWGLRNIFTITVDNASSNDTAMGYLKKKVLGWGVSAVRSKYMHIRCIAHILNLIVQDGLKDVSEAVKKVRECVRYVRNSPARLRKFKEFAELVGIQSKACVCLDVPTRWNSTYLMLKTACVF